MSVVLADVDVNIVLKQEIQEVKSAHMTNNLNYLECNYMIWTASMSMDVWVLHNTVYGSGKSSFNRSIYNHVIVW